MQRHAMSRSRVPETRAVRKHDRETLGARLGRDALEPEHVVDEAVTGQVHCRVVTKHEPFVRDPVGAFPLPSCVLELDPSDVVADANQVDVLSPPRLRIPSRHLQSETHPRVHSPHGLRERELEVGLAVEDAPHGRELDPVSYTHLTLPTIYSV